MKVVSIVGGLGSQMFKYAFYLALKEKYQDQCYIDNSFYSQRECWNGYELKRIFGIDAKLFADVMAEDQLFGYNKNKYYLESCIDYLKRDNTYYYLMGKRHRFKKNAKVSKTRLDLIKKVTYLGFFAGIKHSYSLDDFNNSDNIYFDEYFHNSDEHFSNYKDLIKNTFKFPEFDDEQNKKTSNKMINECSVAIHVRRGDHLSDNVNLFKYGYYKKAVNHIKNNTKDNLVFYLFSDDLNWCKDNLHELGLENDNVVYVDWNKKEGSYKDMQLMTYCQHNVIAISSFSWWGYYLSKRIDKIVISPKKYWLDVKVHY